MSNDVTTNKSDLIPFEEKHLAALTALRDMEDAKRDLEDKISEVKSQIADAMEEYGVTSVKTSFMTIIKTKDSESVSLDTKKFKEEYPKVYDKYFKLFPKVTKRKGSVQFRMG